MLVGLRQGDRWLDSVLFRLRRFCDFLRDAVDEARHLVRSVIPTMPFLRSAETGYSARSIAPVHVRRPICSYAALISLMRLSASSLNSGAKAATLSG